jgi:phosphate transport system permease protein
LIGGLLAINLSEFSTTKFITKIRNAVDFFTNIPFVVYGYLLLLAFNRFVDFNNQFNNILFGGLILGSMMLPMIISRFIHILQSIPYDQREGAYSLGATRYKTAFMVLIPSQSKLFLSEIITISTRMFCEILILLLVTSIFIEKIEVIISIFVIAIIGTWISQLLKKSHYQNGAI